MREKRKHVSFTRGWPHAKANLFNFFFHQTSCGGLACVDGLPDAVRSK